MVKKQNKTKQNRKIGKGNLYLTENRLSRNEMWYAADNHNHKCLIKAVIYKISNFQEIAPHFTNLQKLYS